MFITKEIIKQRLDRCYFVLLRQKLPIGLHSSPTCRSERFCAIGQIDWASGNDPKPLLDVFCGEGLKHYHKINRMLREACDELGIPFMNMS